MLQEQLQQQAAMSQMAYGCISIVLLRHVAHQLSFSQIGQRLGMPEATFRTQGRNVGGGHCVVIPLPMRCATRLSNLAMEVGELPN